jgi:CheY-like chemotaxis protein
MRKIVIIEDNAVVARLYENKLLAAGNTVNIAMDGAEGLKLIYEIKPDLVLLDLMLPNMSGIEIIKKIREDYRFENLPIMAYSSADEEMLTQAVNAGSTTVVSKNSASFKQILEQFNELLEVSRTWQIYNPANFKNEVKDEDDSKSAAQAQILIVEDEMITARIIADIAEKAGIKPVIVDDGQEAYRILSSEANFVAAVLDVELPKIKGTDLLKYMRSEKRLLGIPVVVMTASSDYIKLQIESYRSGATFFISKPFERSTFEMIFKTLVKA